MLLQQLACLYQFIASGLINLETCPSVLADLIAGHEGDDHAFTPCDGYVVVSVITHYTAIFLAWFHFLLYKSSVPATLIT